MFITLEGPEGSGKTSHIPHLVEFLREKGWTVFPTREPGGTSIGEQVREILHSLKNTEMNPRTETLLYQAARAQFVEQVIRPRLALGEVGAWFAAHRQVRAAADLAALAGAGAVTADPCGRAEDVAGSNGARLLSCAVEGRAVRVVVGLDAPTRLGPAHELTGTALAGPG